MQQWVVRCHDWVPLLIQQWGRLRWFEGQFWFESLYFKFGKLCRVFLDFICSLFLIFCFCFSVLFNFVFWILDIDCAVALELYLKMRILHARFLGVPIMLWKFNSQFWIMLNWMLPEPNLRTMHDLFYGVDIGLKPELRDSNFSRVRVTLGFYFPWLGHIKCG
jgi:hypothetical protein